MNDHTKQPLTVLHIFSGDLWAGAEVMVFNLLNQLKDDPGLKIIALSLNEGILTDKLRAAGVETYSMSEADHSFLSIFLKTSSLLKAKKIDIIHSHRYKENLLALLLAKSMRVKRLVSTLHGLPEPPFKQNRANSDRLKTKMDYFLLRRYFSRVIAVSQEMKKTLVQEYRFNPDNVEVIYNGIPLLPYSPSPDRGSPTPDPRPLTPDPCLHIGTVGRMVAVKDYDLFLDIVAEIKKQGGNLRFSLLGDGPLKQHLQDRAQRLGISDCIDFLPPTPDPFPYYHSLDLYLNTSLHEGVPLSILEAMSCGVPVVAPNVGGLPEIVLHGEHGLLVEGRETEKFVRSCLTLIQNKDMRITMGETASKRIAFCFDSFKMAECYGKLYRKSCQKF